MKKSIVLMTFLVCFIFSAKAGTDTIFYKAIKVDVGLGYTSNNISTYAGGMFTLEPHYRINDRWAVGLRYQNAGIIDSVTAPTTSLLTLSNTKEYTVTYTSYCITANYYFPKSARQGSFRMFLGGGVGVFSESRLNSATTYSLTGNFTYTTTSNRNTTTHLGYFPTIGFELWHIRSSFDYSVTGGSYQYYSINFGFFFGGGKKKHP